MQTSPLTVAAALVCWCGIAAQAQIAGPGDGQVRITARGPHHNLCEWSHPETNDAGEVTWKTSRFTQLETGLNRWQPPANPGDLGQWVPASEEFILTPDGAAATNGQHHVFISGQLNQDGAVRIELPSGEIIATRIYGLAYYSPSTGQSTLIAELKDCQGTLLPNKHQIIFSDAFTDIGGSVRFSYSRAGFEQDVILDTQIPPPSEWGMNQDDVQLEVLTECTQMPQPESEIEILADGSVDQTLKWHDSRMGHGKAFYTGKESDGLPVNKQWINLEGRNFLIEHVHYRQIEPQLQDLPPAPQPADGTLQPLRHKVNSGRVLNLRRAERKTSTPMKMAMRVEPSKGYIIDYQILNSQANVTLCGGTTYYLTGPVVLSQTTIVENCIVKFTNNASIAFNGTVQFLSAPYAPALFLGKDDNSAGDQIPGANGKPTNSYASVALDFNTGASVLTMQNIRVANAQTAIRFWGASGHVISHAQFANCVNGISATDSDLSVRNALFWNVQTNFTGTGSTVRGEFLTIDGAKLMVQTVSVGLTNSLLVAVTNCGTYNGTGNFTASDPSTIFQAVKSGLHYLANNSPYRDVVSGPVTPALFASLTNMTTYPPLLLTNNISTATTLSRQVLRDTDTLDAGYHYQVLDYVGGGVSLTAPLILTNGVAIGITGSVSADGLSTGSDVKSSGTATSLNRIASYSYVQECWSNFFGTSFVTTGGGGNCRFRFTEFSIPTAVKSGTTTNAWCQEISFRDCQFHSCNIDVGQVSSTGNAAFTNNLMERGSIYVSPSLWHNPNNAYLFNNCFRYTVITLTNAATHPTIQNNLFDGASQSVNTFYLTSGNNAFSAGTVNSLGGANNKTGFTADYQTGPLGRFYYPSSGTNLYTLIDAGNCNATTMGLYHYTTCANQAKEANSTVDLGFHYVATTSGIPCDGDADTIADYLEDANGDGVSTNDSFDWQHKQTITGTDDILFWMQGRNPRVSTALDVGNLNNLRIYTPLK